MIAIYARQSIDKKDSISIDTQIEYAKHEANTSDDNIRIYKDKGFSGKNTNRPDFERMMSDIELGIIEKVVVYRLDRVSRSLADFSNFITKLENKKVSFISATEKFDTSMPMGRAMLYIIAVFAQLERETIAERLTDNYYERVRNGAIGGGTPLYGFKHVRKKISGVTMTVYDPTPVLDNVKKMFDKYCELNTSLSDVCKMLLEENIFTSNGKTWTNVKLTDLLRSPSYVKADAAIYNYYKSLGCKITNSPEEFDGKHACTLIGKREANKRLYRNISECTLSIASHEGIIDSSVFLYVQNKLSKNKQIKNSGKGKHSWLTGKIKCSYCGYAMNVKAWKYKEKENKVFLCTGRSMYHVCDKKYTVKVQEIENNVLSQLIEKAKLYDAQAPENKNNDAIIINSKIKDIENRIQALILSLEDATPTTMKYINLRIEELDYKKTELLKEYNEAAVQNIIKIPKLDYSNLDEKSIKMLVNLLIDHVSVSEKTVDIFWK